MTFQIADVQKPLAAVSKHVNAGHRVVFEKSGSYIEDTATGERMWMKEDEGMYALKLKVKQCF